MIAVRFPHWAELGVSGFPSTGTDHAIFRLGDAMTVRVPRTAEACANTAGEYRALAGLVGLPLETPRPIALSDDPIFAVYRWIEGTTPLDGEIAKSTEAAARLGRFVSAFRLAPIDGAPPAGKSNAHRGTALAGRDRIVRASLEALEGEIDAKAAARIWDSMLELAPPCAPPQWLHGDLHPGNVIVRDGRLEGVIDFGLAAVGDAAADLAAGWMVFDAEARPAFRAAAGLDDAAWARGRGWALYQGLVALAFYRDRNPALAAIARAAIDRVLEEAS